jgi:hypothetical protein
MSAAFGAAEIGFNIGIAQIDADDAVASLRQLGSRGSADSRCCAGDDNSPAHANTLHAFALLRCRCQLSLRIASACSYRSMRLSLQA